MRKVIMCLFVAGSLLVLCSGTTCEECVAQQVLCYTACEAQRKLLKWTDQQYAECEQGCDAAYDACILEADWW